MPIFAASNFVKKKLKNLARVFLNMRNKLYLCRINNKFGMSHYTNMSLQALMTKCLLRNNSPHQYLATECVVEHQNVRIVATRMNNCRG